MAPSDAAPAMQACFYNRIRDLSRALENRQCHSGSKLRLAHPEERSTKRLESPQTDWDVLHGLIQSYRESDITGARPYLEKHAKGHEERVLDLLDVWAKEMVDPELRREAETLRFGLKQN